jgi:hypothetical protein
VLELVVEARPVHPLEDLVAVGVDYYGTSALLALSRCALRHGTGRYCRLSNGA